MQPNHTPTVLPSAIAFAAALLALATPAMSQCNHLWLPGDAVAGTNGPVRASGIWDADGPGPAPALLVVGGEFQTAGTIPANHIAAWNPTTGAWQAFGTGLDGKVAALAKLPNGDLIATGDFLTAGGIPANRIARWDGTAWTPLGTGLADAGFALTTLANGDIVVGGRFTTAGTTPANRIARWNGSTWSALGSGCDHDVLALTTTPGGDVIAGGRFNTAGGAPADYIARWNGTAWSAMGSGMDADVRALTCAPNGDVIAGGYFYFAGGTFVGFAARWNGTTWSALGGGLDGGVLSAQTFPNGDILLGGFFANAGGSPASTVARWNGSTWASLGAGAGGGVDTVAVLPNGDAIAGGQFTTTWSVGAAGVARWNGATWAPLTPGTNGPVFALGRIANDVLAGGFFTTIGGVAANGLARSNGTTWTAIPGTPGSGVTAFATLSANELAVAYADYPVYRVALWNGTWTAIGTFNDPVSALLRTPTGQLFAGGNFTLVNGVAIPSVAMWSGGVWSAVGGGQLGGNAQALALLQPNGELVVGGNLLLPGGPTEIAAWNGASWTSMSPSGSTGTGTCTSLLADFGGGLYAGGVFPNGPTLRYVLQRSGGTWSALGAGIDGPVLAMAAVPGSLVIGGSFTTAGGVPAAGIARWDGSAWSAVSSSALGGNAPNASPVTCLTAARTGEIVAGGYLTTAGGGASAYLARARTTCPALAVPYGTGCQPTTIGTGPMTMVAGDLPWLGATFTAATINTTWLGLPIGVLGLSQLATPMPAVLPQGVPGCTLYVSPDLLTFFTMGTTSVFSGYAIPNANALAGAQFFHQLVMLETPTGSAITAITSSNALALTIGQW